MEAPMGVNGRNTTINLSGQAHSNSGNGNSDNNGGNGNNWNNGNGGGNSGGGGGNKGPGPIPKEIPDALKIEVRRVDFNRAAPKDGMEKWEAKRAKVEEYNARFDQRVLMVASDSRNSRDYWVSYGAPGNAKYKQDNPGITHKSGAIHIFQRHEKQFTDIGINHTGIMTHLINVLEEGKLVSRRENKDGYEEIRMYNERKYLFGLSKENFIVTARPYTSKT